jgi:anaerobic selenocysteine-containing dehydrogenase
VPPPGEALAGWEILCRLARALGLEGFDYASADEIARELPPLPPAEDVPAELPDWLAAPGEHDYLGAHLAQRVEGLRALLPDWEAARKEEQHVPLA